MKDEELYRSWPTSESMTMNLFFFYLEHTSYLIKHFVDRCAEWWMEITKAPISAIRHSFCNLGAAFCEVIAGYHRHHRYQYLFINLNSRQLFNRLILLAWVFGSCMIILRALSCSAMYLLLLLLLLLFLLLLCLCILFWFSLVLFLLSKLPSSPAYHLSCVQFLVR